MPIKNQPAADAIAEALSNGITHPGADKRQAANLYLPGLNPRGKPTHMAEAIKAGNQAIAEAIIHHIETNLDSTIITNVALNELRGQVQSLESELEYAQNRIVG